MWTVRRGEKVEKSGEKERRVRSRERGAIANCIMTNATAIEEVQGTRQK
jgi:hypothetical protein